MIKLEDMTPDVYYQESRDFQLIGRLYDIVLNYVKTNSELINNLPFNDNVDEQLITLLAYTLGFKSNRSYNTKQLIAICSVFSKALSKKGTTEAIEIVGTALLSSEGITEDLTVEVENNNISVLVPSKLSDINLLRDVLSYLIPAGATINLVRLTSVENKVDTKNTLQNKVNYEWDLSESSNNPAIEDTKLGHILTTYNTENNYDNNRVKGKASATPNITVIKPPKEEN